MAGIFPPLYSIYNNIAIYMYNSIAYMYVCTYVCLHTTQESVVYLTSMCVYIYIYIYIWIYMCMHASMNMHVCATRMTCNVTACVCVFVCAYVQIYANLNIYIHTKLLFEIRPSWHACGYNNIHVCLHNWNPIIFMTGNIHMCSIYINIYTYIL